MSGCNGIDVSNNNGTLDLSKGFSGLDFVIAKATEGTTFADPDYEHYKTQAAQLGVVFGAYHFLHPEEDPIAQADYFCTVAQPESGMILWIDYETYTTTPQQEAEAINTMVARIKSHYPDAVTGLYSNLSGFQRVASVKLATDVYWYANPDGQLNAPQPLPGWAGNWMIHQYEVFAGVDRNWCNRSRQDLEATGSWQHPTVKPRTVTKVTVELSDGSSVTYP